MLGSLLNVERGPAGIAHGTAAEPEDMDPDRESGFDRGFEDRPIAALAQKVARSAEKQHMRKAAVAGALANFHACELGVLVWDDHGCFETRVASVPAVQLIFIGGKGHRRTELIVLLALPTGRERIHDAPLDAVHVEILFTH